MRRINTVFYLCCILFLLAPANLLAGDIKIHFAGFAFRGSFDQIQANYPHSLEISRDLLPDQRNVINAALVEKVKDLRLKNGRIVIGELADLGDGSLTLACSLDTELVSIEEYLDGFKIVINLGAQALLFDYGNMRLAASYPIMVELVDFVTELPDEAMVRDRIRDLLLTPKYGINLLDDFVSIVRQVELKKSYASAIKVTEVVVEERALEALSANFANNIDNFKMFIAQSFGKYISKNQNAYILPYTKGSDIGNTMAVRFSDARVFELTIPEPQYAVELTVRGFKKVCTEEKAAGASWVYGAYTNIKITQPALGKTYLDKRFQHAVSRIVSSHQKTVQDWPIYQNSLVALFNDVTKKLGEQRQYRDVRHVLEQCR